jgi:gas vesicle protein
MGIAESMKGLTEDILASYDVRVKALGDIVADTHKIVADARKTMKCFTSDRKKMSTEQAEALGDYMKDLTNNVADLIKGFAKNHRQMSEEQAKNLAEFVKNIAKEVSSKLKDFQKQRQETSEKLKDRLNKEIKDIRNWVKDTVNNTQALVTEYRSDMTKARHAWQGMTASLGKFRETGVMAKIKAGGMVAPAEETKKKGRGKKRGRKKGRK